MLFLVLLIQKRAEERGYKVVSDSEGSISMQKVEDESANNYFILVWN